VEDAYGGWIVDQPRPPSYVRRRRSRPWLRALAGTWLAATVAGGPVAATPSASATASHAPIDVTAATGDSEVTLSWRPAQASSADFGFYVYEGTSPGGESRTPVNASPVTDLSYKVPALTNGTTYYFTVASAIEAQVLSDGRSTEVSAIPAATAGSPAGLTVTPGHSQAILSWTAPASDGGSALTSYRVYDGTTAGFQDGTAATTSTGTSATVTRLTDGTTYYFRVAAVNAVGEGPASGEASTTLAADRVPGSPTGLTATAGGSRVTLSWTAPASDGGTAITGYIIDRGTSPGHEPGTPVNGSLVKATSFTVSGLTRGTTYYFRVAAVNAVGGGPPSEETSATLPAVASSESPGSSASLTTSVFAAPTGLTAAEGDTRVDLSWTAPASDGGSPVTSYNVYWATVPGFQSSALVTRTTGTSTTVTGLTSGMTYYFRVAAVNAAGNESPFSAEVPARPGQAVIANLTGTRVPNQLIVLLAAVAVAATAGAAALVMWGRRQGLTRLRAGTGRTRTAWRNRR
jgi:predicted phage tail protein